MIQVRATYERHKREHEERLDELSAQDYPQGRRTTRTLVGVEVPTHVKLLCATPIITYEPAAVISYA